jgi:hypothetical protein
MYIYLAKKKKKPLQSSLLIRFARSPSPSATRSDAAKCSGRTRITAPTSGDNHVNPTPTTPTPQPQPQPQPRHPSFCTPQPPTNAPKSSKITARYTYPSLHHPRTVPRRTQEPFPLVPRDPEFFSTLPIAQKAVFLGPRASRNCSPPHLSSLDPGLEAERGGCQVREPGRWVGLHRLG